jgi:hypothetical protein
MIFADKEAEDLFIEYNNKYSIQHINSKVPITVEAIESLKTILEEFEKEFN